MERMEHMGFGLALWVSGIYMTDVTGLRKLIPDTLHRARAGIGYAQDRSACVGLYRVLSASDDGTLLTSEVCDSR